MAKKILHISHTDIRYDSRVLKEMTALSEINEYKVYGLGFQRGYEDSFNAEAVKFEAIVKRIRSLEWNFLPSTIRYFCEALELSLYALFFGLKLRPNIIHCHDVNPLLASSFLSLLFKVSIIYDAHELESDRNSLSSFNGNLVKIVEKFCWSRVTHFITVSDSIVSWYQENIGKKDSTIIYNAPMIDVDEINKSPNREYLRQKFNIPQESLIGIYVGLLDSGRGVKELVKTYKNLGNDFHLVFMGYGSFSSELKEISVQFSNIHYHNKVRHDLVVPILKSADIGFCLIENVSLSAYYCLPNKIFEYANAGLFIVACDFPEIKSILTQYQSGQTFDTKLYGLEDFLRRKKVNLINRVPVLCPEEFKWSFQEKKLTELYSKFI
jgi:glycosyltransferase involved in cell wall biosynthesis